MGTTPNGHSSVFVFGDLQFSSSALELRRNGEIIRVQAQPAKVLAVLLSRPGELVSREELRRELWGESHYVGFDDALNHVIKSLRTALRDDAASPRYIETVPRRGYRFIAEVARLERPADDTPSVQPDSTNEVSDGSISSAPLHSNGDDASHPRSPEVAPPSASLDHVAAATGLPARSSERRPTRAITVAAAIVALVLLATVTFSIASRSPGTPRVTSVRQLTHFGLAQKVVSDGEQLYVQQDEGGRSTLVRFPASGGAQPAPIPTPFRNVVLLDISPDHKDLLIAEYERFGDPPAVWLLPLNGSSPRRLGDWFANYARWSPDGSHLALSGGTSLLPGALYLADADGSHPRKLSDQSGEIAGWSPDGRSVRFTQTNPQTGGMSIWEVAIDGSHLHAFFPELQPQDARWDEGQCCGRWTPDGRYFIFRQSTGITDTLWARAETTLPISRNNGTEIYATSLGLYSLQLMSLGAHGARAYAVGRKDARELLWLDAKLGRFVPLLAGTSAMDLTWSRARDTVAYVTVPDKTLWRAKPDGSARVQLTFPPMQVYYSKWSPDGSRLAAHVLLPGKPGKVIIVPAAGGAPRVLFANEPTAEGDPIWSPDGKILLFARVWLDSNGNEASSGLCTLDLKTGRLQKIQGSDGMSAAAWSPDGRYIVAKTDSFRSLMLFDFAKRSWKKIATGTYIDQSAWSSDGKTVFYQDRRASEDEPIFRLTLSTGKIEKVAGRAQFLDSSDVAGFKFVGLTPHDEPIISAARRSADVYAFDLELP